MVNCIASKHRGMQFDWAAYFAESHRKNEEDIEAQGKAYWEEYGKKRQIASAFDIPEDEEALKTEIRWCYLYYESNRGVLAAQFGIPLQKLNMIIQHPTTFDCMKTLDKLAPEEIHRLYLKYRGPLACGCPCVPCSKKRYEERIRVEEAHNARLEKEFQEKFRNRYNQFEIVMTQEHQDAWDEIAAEQLALAKAEMAQRSPEEQASRDKAFWEKFRKGEIVSAEIVEDD